MTRFGLDAVAALRVIDERTVVDPRHQLVGPQLLRSQVLSLLYQRLRTGVADEAESRQALERLAGLKIRLLGDRVSRATTWKIARRHGLSDTMAAEYVAVAQLQADALIALDPAVRQLAEAEISVAAFDDLGH
ncbi:MAG TPA: hypothetical protein VFU98_01205 [Microlunatus sp.]|nr:hypothetical protein [Microlunatus sp.]